MARAYLYERSLIKELIPSGSAGVYILGKYLDGLFIPVYVGRSDSCLLARLLGHNHKQKATHVQWKLLSSAKKAFNMECTLYHTYEEEGFLNQIHPASPKGSHLICPICSMTIEDLENNDLYKPN